MHGIIDLVVLIRFSLLLQGEPGSFGMVGLPGPAGRGLPGSKVTILPG